MRINDVFPSKYLKADELDGDLALTIRDVQIEKVGSGKDAEDKPVLYFEETDKGLACNKTNCKTISKLYGDETDDWIGKRIALFATEVDFQGDQVLAIRVRMKAPGGRPAAAPQQRQAPPTRQPQRPGPRAVQQQPEDEQGVEEVDIPF